jgi:hypothetical protein
MLLPFCKSENKHNGAQTHVTNDSSYADTISGKMDFLLLSPNEILDEIFSEKMTINPQWVNPKSNADKYVDTRQQALNLGVYISDFAYLTINNNKTNALDYFKIIRNLAQKVNVTGYFNEAFFDRIETNLANNDSIINISKEMYYSMSDILEEANRQNIFALVASGAIIETLYLSSMQVKDYSKYQRLAQRIFDQKQLFDNFYGYSSQYQSDKNVKAVLLQLESLKKIFEGQSKIEKSKVVKDSKNHITIHSDDASVVNEQQFLEFKEDIKRVRQEIVRISGK